MTRIFPWHMVVPYNTPRHRCESDYMGPRGKKSFQWGLRAIMSRKLCLACHETFLISINIFSSVIIFIIYYYFINNLFFKTLFFSSIRYAIRDSLRGFCLCRQGKFTCSKHNDKGEIVMNVESIYGSQSLNRRPPLWEFSGPVQAKNQTELM